MVLKPSKTPGIKTSVQVQNLIARKKGTLWKLRIAVYGLDVARKEWYETISAWLISIGVIRSKTDPAFYHYGKNGRFVDMLMLHVDDPLQARSARFDQVIN